MREKEQTEDFSFRGTWWLPEAPDEKVSGKLTFDSNEGVTLELEHPLEANIFTHPLKQKSFNRPPIDPQRYFGVPVILGRHDAGPLCTVFGTMEESHDTGGAGVVRVEYGGSGLAIGVGVDDVDERFVTAIYFRCGNLETWIGDQPFGRAPPSVAEDFDYTLTYKYPEKFAARVDAHGFTIFTHPIIHESSEAGVSGVRVEHQCPLRLEFDQPRSIEDAVNLATEVKRLLTLMMDFPSYFLQVRVEGIAEAGETFTSTLYFAQPYRRMKDIFQLQMPLPFPAVRDRFGTVLSGWLDRAKRLRAVYELIETIFYGPNMATDVALLTLTQAFETFHRDQIGGVYTDAATYETIRQTLVAAIPTTVGPDHRAALEKRLEFANTFSMSKRIRTALKSLGDDAVKVITRNPGAFSKRIADTRNYFTHRDEGSKGDVIPDKDVFVATEKFRYFLLVLMMQVLGIPPVETVVALEKWYQRKAILDSDVI